MPPPAAIHSCAGALLHELAVGGPRAHACEPQAARARPEGVQHGRGRVRPQHGAADSRTRRN